jgi:hypothetical protein
LIPIKVDGPAKDILSATTDAQEAPNSERSAPENCARIRDLGYTTSKHVKMYGERFDLVSEPFEEGACTAVHALSGNDPTIRTLRLPVSILVGLSGRFRQKAK